MSETNTALDILKSAILLEKRGKAFYSKVAAEAENPGVKKIFLAMAEEEDLHLKMLGEQYRTCKADAGFVPAPRNMSEIDQVAQKILATGIKDRISAAGFEASAIGAAIDMEENAVKLYSDRAVNTNDPEEKKLYSRLSDWERTHLNLLLDIDRALIEKVWNDNNFWPF